MLMDWIGHTVIARKQFYSMFEPHSWKQFINFKQVDSGSCIMEHTLEITVFPLFDKLSLNIA